MKKLTCLILFFFFSSYLSCIEGIEPEYPLDDMIKDDFTLKYLLQTGEEEEKNHWFFALDSEISELSKGSFSFGDSLYYFEIESILDNDGIHESSVLASKAKNYVQYKNFRWKHKLLGNYNLYKTRFLFNIKHFYSENKLTYHSIDKQFNFSGSFKYVFNSFIPKFDYIYVSKPESNYLLNPWLYYDSGNFIIGVGLNIIDNDSLNYNPSAYLRYNPNLNFSFDLTYKHELNTFRRQAHFDEFQLLWESEADQTIPKSNVAETLKAQLEYNFLKSKIKLVGFYSKSNNKFDYEWVDNSFKISKINQKTDKLKLDYCYSNYWITIGGSSEIIDVNNFESKSKLYSNLSLRIYPLTYLVPNLTWIDGLKISDKNYSIGKASIKLLYSISSSLHFSLGFQEVWDTTNNQLKKLHFDNSEIPYGNKVFFRFFLGSYDQFASTEVQ